MTQTTGSRSTDDPTEGFARLAEIAGKVVAPTTLVIALMVYFGWAGTSVTYAAFGIDQSALGFSVQDYLFRSLNATFKPLAAVLLALLALLPGHAALVRLLRRHQKATLPLSVALGALGLVLTVVGLLGLTRLVTYFVAWPLIPMSLGLGVLLVGYCMMLFSAVTKPLQQPDGERRPEPRVVMRVALAMFVVLTLFWSVAVYAQLRGLTIARDLAAQPGSLPGVVVFAPQQLHIDGPGIRETRLPGDRARYRYRYDGLRLLIRTNERFFLLPAEWRPGARTVVLLDEPSLRVEFFRGPGS